MNRKKVKELLVSIIIMLAIFLTCYFTVNAASFIEPTTSTEKTEIILSEQQGTKPTKSKAPVYSIRPVRVIKDAPSEIETLKPTKQPSQPLLESIGVFVLTAYCPCSDCSGPWKDMTSTGVIAQPTHTVAVDPKIIPYGTKLSINGVIYTAEDCGSSVKGNIIDIFFNTHDEVDEFGLQYAEVYIVKDAN